MEDELRYRGMTYYMLRQPDKAKLDLELAVQLNPVDPRIQEWANFLRGLRGRGESFVWQ